MKVTIRTLNSEQTIEYILDANDYYTKKKGYGYITGPRTLYRISCMGMAKRSIRYYNQEFCTRDIYYI